MKRAGILSVLAASLLVAAANGEEREAETVEMRARSNAAKAAISQRNYPEAARIYQEMHARFPKNVTILSNLATVQRRLEQFKESEDTLRKALELAPEDGICRRTLGIVLYLQRKYGDAEVELKKAMAIDPKDAEAILYLAYCGAEKGQLELANKQFEAAVRLESASKERTLALNRRWYFEVSRSADIQVGGVIRKADNGQKYYLGDIPTPLEQSRLRLPPPLTFDHPPVPAFK